MALESAKTGASAMLSRVEQRNIALRSRGVVPARVVRAGGFSDAIGFEDRLDFLVADLLEVQVVRTNRREVRVLLEAKELSAKILGAMRALLQAESSPSVAASEQCRPFGALVSFRQ